MKTRFDEAISGDLKITLLMAKGQNPIACARCFDYAAKNEIKTVVRGVRNTTDYEYEAKMAAFNKEKGGVETVFFMADEKLCDCSSTEVRRRIENGEPLVGIVPGEVLEMVNKMF